MPAVAAKPANSPTPGLMISDAVPAKTTAQSNMLPASTARAALRAVMQKDWGSNLPASMSAMGRYQSVRNRPIADIAKFRTAVRFAQHPPPQAIAVYSKAGGTEWEKLQNLAIGPRRPRATSNPSDFYLHLISD